MHRLTLTQFLIAFPGFPFYSAGDDVFDKVVEPFSKLSPDGYPRCFYLDDYGIPTYQMVCVREKDGFRALIVRLPPNQHPEPYLRSI
jgi:hypothetical protein